MAKYKKKLIEIEAIQWTGSIKSFKEISDFANDKISLTDLRDRKILLIETLEGKMFVKIGGYIIKGIDGEFSSCREDIFLKTYDKVGE